MWKPWKLFLFSCLFWNFDNFHSKFFNFFGIVISFAFKFQLFWHCCSVFFQILYFLRDFLCSYRNIGFCCRIAVWRVGSVSSDHLLDGLYDAICGGALS